MTVTQWVIVILSGIIAIVFAVGSAYLVAEKKKHERELNEVRKQGAENAKRTSDAITEAEKIKSNSSTGNHLIDIDTMARQLQIYADSGK